MPTVTTAAVTTAMTAMSMRCVAAHAPAGWWTGTVIRSPSPGAAVPPLRRGPGLGTPGEDDAAPPPWRAEYVRVRIPWAPPGGLA
ncbi:hypothetical protein GCM10027261_33640 [Geodermatophilus arenarius]